MTPTEFGALFETFERSAFRLEVLPAYEVEEEREFIAEYVRGEPFPSFNLVESWTKVLSAAAANGKRFTRAWLLPQPLSTYARMSLDWVYPLTFAAGEELLFIRRAVPSKRLAVVDHDFWLFDERILVLMEYDQEGRFICPRLVTEESEVQAHRRLAEVIRASAISLHELFRLYRSGQIA